MDTKRFTNKTHLINKNNIVDYIYYVVYSVPFVTRAIILVLFILILESNFFCEVNDDLATS